MAVERTRDEIAISGIKECGMGIEGLMRKGEEGREGGEGVGEV